MNAPLSTWEDSRPLTEREQFAIWCAEERAAFVARFPKARDAQADDAAAGFANLMIFNAKRHGRVFAPAKEQF